MSTKLSRIWTALESTDEQGTVTVVDATNVTADIGKELEADTKPTGEALPEVTILATPDSLVEVSDDIAVVEEEKAALEAHVAIIKGLVDNNETISGSLAKAIKVSTRHLPARVFDGYRPVESVEAFSAPIQRMTTTLRTQDILIVGISNLDHRAKRLRNIKQAISIALESADGTAQVVDVVNVSASIPKPTISESENLPVDEVKEDIKAGGEFADPIKEDEKRQGEAVHKQLEEANPQLKDSVELYTGTDVGARKLSARLHRLESCLVSVEGYIAAVHSESAKGNRIDSGTIKVIKADLLKQYPVFFSALDVAAEDFDTSLHEVFTQDFLQKLQSNKVAMKVAINRDKEELSKRVSRLAK